MRTPSSRGESWGHPHLQKDAGGLGGERVRRELGPGVEGRKNFKISCDDYRPIFAPKLHTWKNGANANR